MSLNPENKQFITGEGVRELLNQLNQKNKSQTALIYNDINDNTHRISTNEDEIQTLHDKITTKLENHGETSIVGNLDILKEPDDIQGKTGNLRVYGDLLVEGKTVTVDTETLQVKDNFIIINSDNEDVGTSLSGVIIKGAKDDKDTLNAYGIAYDPVNKSVSLGHGVITDDNDFAFNVGENNPILTRAESVELEHNHVLVWDADKNKAVDGGVYNSIDELEKTFATLNMHESLALSLGEKVKEESVYRTAADEGLSLKIDNINDTLSVNINDIKSDISNIKRDISNVDEMNDSISKILAKIESGDVQYDKMWMLSFEPIYDSLNNILGYKPYFTSMDDGEIN